MTRAEFLSWVDFYELHPFDDFHRFHRPAALVSVSLGGGNASEKLEWLQPTPQEDVGGLSEADINTLRAFGLRK
jgi:hypothetical protein